MPTVRRFERQVTTAALPGARKTAAATPQSEGVNVEIAKGNLEAARHIGRAQTWDAVGGLADTVGRMGSAMYGQIVEQARQDATEHAAVRSSNQLDDKLTPFLYDPQRGVYNTRKGESANELPEEVQTYFNKVADEIDASLSTPEQRANFSRFRAQRWSALNLDVYRYVSGEQGRLEQQEMEAFIGNRRNDAIAHALDPRLSEAALTEAVSAIRTRAPRFGLGPETIDAQIRAVQSETRIGVISSLLAQDKDQAAATYFAAVREQIAGDKVDGIQRAIEEGSLRGASQKQADEIIRTGGTLSEQRARAREIQDPKLRDQVEQRIEHNAAVQERIDREAEQASMRRGYDILDESHDVTKIPPALWTSYDGSTRSAMIAYARTRAKGQPVETDLAAYYTLINNAGANPEAFATDNLLKYRHKLGETEFKQLAGLQLSIKEGNRTAAEKVLAPYEVDRQLLEDNLRLYGYDPKDDKLQPAIAQLRQLLRSRGDFLQKGGKKVTHEDVQSIIDEVLTQQIETEGRLWGSTKKRLIEATIDDVPASFRRRYPGDNETVLLSRWIEAVMNVRR